jgi:hypothetical protein
MSEATALARLQAAGVRLELVADGTVALKAAAPPSTELLATARRHRDEIAAPLRQHDMAAADRGAAAVAAGPADGIEAAERAAIREVDS